jgi:tetratricopeptide (TPR) repeat protein
MRFADTATHLGSVLGVTLLALLTGCASINLPAWGTDAPPSAPEAAPAAASTKRAAAATAVAAPAPALTEPPAPTLAERAAAILKAEPEVPIAAQRSFDDARKALRAGRVEEAERGFRALAKEHPELGGPQANLGLIHRQSGKLTESATALEKAVQLSPRQATYFNQLGITYRQQGQFTKARDAYQTAIDLDPTYAAAVLNLGILHDLYLWDGKRALELYDRYLALSPAGDAVVSKWIADLKNRKAAPITVSRKEQS